MSDMSNKRTQFPQTGSGAGGTGGQSFKEPGSLTQKPAEKTRDVAEQVGAAARDLKDHAAGLADATARELKDRASGLADTAKEMVAGAGETLRSTVEDQKQAGADQVSHIARAIRTAASELDSEIPQAAQYVRRAAAQIENVSDAFRRRNVGELITEAQDFARRHPTAFLGATVLAGFALVRFLKTSAEQPGGTAQRSHGSFGTNEFAGAADQRGTMSGSQPAWANPRGVSPPTPDFAPTPGRSGPNRP